ncbi:hypothetical protein, partial [Streptomyces cinereoruber]|uniref:hypothetical protein n=1 Tax=Streptomyces cinereoruber TaxID=67260 RepID=UPI003669470F
MTLHITFDLPTPSRGSRTLHLPDDVALALYNGLTNNPDVTDPQAKDFDGCCHVIGDVVTCGQERTVAFCCSGGGGCAGSA